MSNLSTKPYLLRAIYEWCVDSGLTPYLSVKVDGNTRVPLEFVKDGLIVLNFGPNATRNLTMDNHTVAFHARFNGVSREVSVPVGAVTGIFARENGEGLAFEVDVRVEGEAQDSVRLNEAATDDPDVAGTAGTAGSAGTAGAPAQTVPIGLSLATPSEAPASAAGKDSDPTPPGKLPPRGKPSLRVIK